MNAIAADTREYRNALGRFATGVAIMTTRDAQGQPVGLTANSFSSVSLDPMLILWSLRRDAPSLPVFEKADYFAVNVLRDAQIDLSNRFARPGDKFAGVAWLEGAGGVPVIDGCLARFECRRHRVLDGGDHLIFMGEVECFGYADGAPLLFYAGQYGVTAPHPHLPVS